MSTPTDEDIDNVIARLSSLAYAGAARASSKGIRAGLKVLVKAMRAGVPVDKGLLRQSLGTRFRKTGKDAVIRAKAGLNVGKKQGQKRGYAPHAHLVALGTQPRWKGIKYGYTRGVKGKKRGKYDPRRDSLSEKAKKGGRIHYTGIMPANDFISDAVRSSGDAAILEMVAVLRTEMENEIRKADAR